MFARLGSFATRFRWFIIAGWIVLAVVLTLVAPNINNVGVTDQRAFLAKSAPSLDANAMVTKYFPANVSPSSAVIVVDAGNGNRADQGQPLTFVESLTKWLTSSSTPKAVDQVWSPTYGDDQTRASLLSSDKQVALVLVRFNAIGSQQITKDALAQIQQHMAAAPAGVKTYLTGDAPILAAYNGNTKGSIDSTTLITIILVIVILLLVYRSPVSPIVPLSTIGLAYIISRGVVALLGAHVLTISMYTNVFLIVVLFGAGTDYCLFLISRFREEMADDPVPAGAVRKTTRSVGETIASSAGTVIVGLATMASAELGLFNTSGPSLAIGVAIALLAALTFTPALLTLLGKRTFWPRKAQHLKEGRFWNSWSHRVVRRPVLALVIPVVILVPLAVYGLGLARDFDLLGDLPKSDATRQGFDVLSAHLGPGVMQPINVLALDAKGFDSPAGLAEAGTDPSRSHKSGRCRPGTQFHGIASGQKHALCLEPTRYPRAGSEQRIGGAAASTDLGFGLKRVASNGGVGPAGYLWLSDSARGGIPRGTARYGLHAVGRRTDQLGKSGRGFSRRDRRKHGRKFGRRLYRRKCWQ